MTLIIWSFFQNLSGDLTTLGTGFFWEVWCGRYWLRLSCHQGIDKIFSIAPNPFHAFGCSIHFCITLPLSFLLQMSVNEQCRKLSKRVAFYTIDCRDSCGEIFFDLQDYKYTKVLTWFWCCISYTHYILCFGVQPHITFHWRFLDSINSSLNTLFDLHLYCFPWKIVFHRNSLKRQLNVNNIFRVFRYF